MDCFRVPPEIKLAAIFRLPLLRYDRGDASAHDHEFLREFGNLRIEAQGLREVGERAAGVYRYLVRILVDHANDEVGGVFVGRLGRGIAFDQVRDFIRTVIFSALPSPVAIAVPRAFVMRPCRKGFPIA